MKTTPNTRHGANVPVVMMNDDIGEYARHVFSDDAVRHGNHEMLGSLASLLAGGASGAAVGRASGSAGAKMIAPTKLGVGIGGAANLIGSLVAAMTRRRTLKEQIRHDRSSALWNYIPGVAGYNQAKRIGANLAFWREIKKRIDKKKPKADSGNGGKV